MHKTLIAFLASLVFLLSPAWAQRLDSSHALVGLRVFSQGERVGKVKRVVLDSAGKLRDVLVKLVSNSVRGEKCVAVPEGQFASLELGLQLSWTLEELDKLPEDDRCWK